MSSSMPNRKRERGRERRHLGSFRLLAAVSFSRAATSASAAAAASASTSPSALVLVLVFGFGRVMSANVNELAADAHVVSYSLTRSLTHSLAQALSSSSVAVISPSQSVPKPPTKIVAYNFHAKLKTIAYELTS